MSDNPELRTYEQTLASMRTERASALRTPRTSPWVMGLSASLATAVPFVVAVMVYLALEPLIYSELWWTGVVPLAVIVAVTLPIPVFVWRLVIDTLRLEHARLVAAQKSLSSEPVLPAPPVFSTGGIETAPAELRPGILANGKVVAPLVPLSTEKARLRGACLKFVRAGAERGDWTRKAIAEGEDALLSGEEWDLASPQLQALGYFWVKPGKGGGIRITDKLTVAEIIARLVVAQ